jgi:hypothetical protein
VTKDGENNNFTTDHKTMGSKPANT